MSDNSSSNLYVKRYKKTIWLIVILAIVLICAAVIVTVQLLSGKNNVVNADEYLTTLNDFLEQNECIEYTYDNGSYKRIYKTFHNIVTSELYYQDPVLNLSNGDIFESHSECQSTQIKKGIFVPRFLCNSVWMEYGKEYLLLGYINEEGTDSTPPVATLPWIFEWDISREEEAEERQQYGLLPRNEDKFVIRDQIMEKYVI